jgi:heme A synthase
MLLIVPEKNVSVRARKIIKKAVLVAAAILMLVVIIGFILWTQEDIWVKNVGKYMTLISLGIIVFQIILGIAVRLIERNKNK